MKGPIFKQIFFYCFVVGLTTSCASITKLFPKEPRPFQSRAFDSGQWKSGDYQTRGEMLDSKLFERIYQIKANQQEQILQLFGEPDERTKAVCCYSGRGGKSTEPVELWLYYVETEDGGKGNTHASQPIRPLTKQALKIYFEGAAIIPNIGERDGDHSYFPIIGYFKRSRQNLNL